MTRPIIFFLCLTAVYTKSAYSLLKGTRGRFPSLDGDKRPLTVDLDVSEFNRYFQKVVEEDIVEEIDDKLKQYIHSSNFTDMIKTSYIEGMTTLMEKQLDIIIENKISELKKDHNLEIQKLNEKINEDRESYAFFAALSSEKSDLSVGVGLIFDEVQLNMGGHYDSSTGKYICPKSGVYMFSWTTVSTSEEDFTSDLMIDNQAIAENVVDNDKTKDAMTGSQTGVVQMQKGQKAWIKVIDGNYVRSSWSASSRTTVFSGFRIQ